MDLNLTVIAGRLAAPPEVRNFESGSRLVRYLITTRSEEPRRRVDVVPVTVWDPDESLLDEDPQPGERVLVTGSVQRRFWSSTAGRKSRLEIVGCYVKLGPESDWQK